ncbi:MAG: response regulator [Nitrospirae bacterium]|nr:MAG: response regulator [Nitrospirota bacterium]
MGMGRVLVVDDEADVRKSVRLILTRAGYDVVEAEDGEKGIAAIKADGNALLVDTIVCDLYMPKVNGMEAIAYFREQFPSVPVVVLTGKPDIPNAASLFKQGIADYLVKPIEAEKLTSAVHRAAQGHVLFKDQFAT